MDLTRKLDPDEIPLPPIAKKDGRAITLRCRTPGEAYLICDELEEQDILSLLPDEDELEAQFERDGYVEVQVSARAYESLADLRPAIEFQFKTVRADQPLSRFGKLLAVYLAVLIVPGMFVFVWLLGSYQKNGYDRMAREFKFWFWLGIATWLLLATLASIVYL